MEENNRIKLLLKPFLLVLLAFSFVYAAIFANASTNGLKTLKVGVPIDRCPVFYIDSDTNEITGIGVDLMKLAASNAGYDVSFVQIEEETLAEAIDNEAYDLLMPFGSAIQSKQGKATLVSENLFQTPFTADGNSKAALMYLPPAIAVAPSIRFAINPVIPSYEVSGFCMKSSTEPPA